MKMSFILNTTPKYLMAFNVFTIFTDVINIKLKNIYILTEVISKNSFMCKKQTFINSIKSRGPSTDPCVTPQVFVNVFNITLLYFTVLLLLRLVRYIS